MKKQMIMVDYEKTIADILKVYFQREGFSIECAYNGQEGLQLIENILDELADEIHYLENGSLIKTTGGSCQ